MCIIRLRHLLPLKNKRWVVWGAFVLTISIVAATMFLKQHTVVDVVLALAMNVVVCILVYRPENSSILVHQREYSGAENS